MLIGSETGLNLLAIPTDVLFPHLPYSSLMAIASTSKAMRYNAIATALEKLAKESDSSDEPHLTNLLVSLFLYISATSPGLSNHKAHLIRVLRDLPHCHLSLYENILICSLLIRLCNADNVREKEIKEVSEFKYKILTRHAVGIDGLLATAIEAIHKLRLGDHSGYLKNAIDLQDKTTSFDVTLRCRKFDLKQLSSTYAGCYAGIILFPLLNQSLFDVDETLKDLWNKLPEDKGDLVTELDQDQEDNHNLVTFLYAFEMLLPQPEFSIPGSSYRSKKSYIFESDKFPNSCVLTFRDSTPLNFELDVLTARWCRNKTIKEINTLMATCEEEHGWYPNGLPIACYLLRSRPEDLASFLEAQIPLRIKVDDEQIRSKFPDFIYRSLSKDDFSTVISKVLPSTVKLEDEKEPFFYFAELIRLIQLRPQDEMSELLKVFTDHLCPLPAKYHYRFKPYTQFFLVFAKFFKDRAASFSGLLFSPDITPYSLAEEICQKATKWPRYSQIEAALFLCMQNCHKEDTDKILALIEGLARELEEESSVPLMFRLLKLRLTKQSTDDIALYRCELKALYEKAISEKIKKHFYFDSFFSGLSKAIATDFNSTNECYQQAFPKLVKHGIAKNSIIHFYQAQPALLGDLSEVLQLIRLGRLYTLKMLRHDQVVTLLSMHLDNLIENADKNEPLSYTALPILCEYVLNTCMQMPIKLEIDDLKVKCLVKIDRLISLAPDDNSREELRDLEGYLISSLRHFNSVTDYFKKRISRINDDLAADKKLSENSCRSIIALTHVCDSAKELAAKLEQTEASANVASQRSSDEQNSGLRAR